MRRGRGFIWREVKFVDTHLVDFIWLYDYGMLFDLAGKSFLGVWGCGLSGIDGIEGYMDTWIEG